MEGTDAPKWGSGLPLAKLNPYPATFTTLFPVSQRPTGIATTNFLSTSRLAPPTAHIRQPAWNRVAIPPHSSTSFKGLIMKRVGLCTPKPASTAFVTPKSEVVVPEKDADAYRYPRPRTLEYEPSEEEHKFAGVPLSRATMAHMMMTAITNVANNFMTTSSDTSLAEKKDTRKGRHVQIAPAKRHIDYSETETAATGNKLTNYTDLVPILWRALQNGLDEVDMKTASFAQASALLHEFRRNPRRHLAANGVPDLSDITDLTEPESPTIVRAPIITAESRSPQKRIARLTTPLKNGNRRVNDNMVKLEPIAASPRADPSPTKSSSVPSTPLQVSATSPVPVLTQPGVQSSPLSRVSLTAPVELCPPVAANSPGRVFRGPSYSDFSSSYMEHLSPVPQSSSPIKHDRPVAPTPSRWARANPSTPHHLTPIPSTPRTNETPIGLASFVAPVTPQLPLPSNYHHFETPTQESEPIEFQFGDASPSFSGMSWMNTSAQTNEPQRVTKLNSRRRRQSEPLLRKYMKREARRRTSSPHKVSFHGDDTFRHDISIASLFTTTTEASKAEVTSKPEPVDEPIPTVVVESTESPIKDVSTNDDPPATTDIASSNEDHTDNHASKQSDILNIDMRENPDIFGSLTSSPPTSRYASMASLAQIAGNSCCGQAKVVITHEKGKLMVRFKLPTDYAYMFPESQGSDESHFSTSPSAISSSPRITFKAPRSSTTFVTMSSPEDRTIQFSTPSALAAFDQTPTMTGRQFADTPNQNTVSSAGGFDQTPTMTGRQFTDTPTQDTVSLPNGFDQTPTMTGRQFADTPSQQASSPAKADRTLTIGELGITSFGPLETPSPKRFSMSPVKRTPVVRTPEVAEPGSASSILFSHLTASAKPLSPLQQTPKEQVTPTQEVIRDEIVVNTPAQEKPAQAPSPVQETPVHKTEPVVGDSTLTVLDSITLTPLNSSAPAPSPKPSFTPVNQSALKTMIKASPRPSSATPSKDHATPPTTAEPVTAPTSRADDYDSPGRAYMRDFIKRSRPKRPSTTETGSPIAPPTKRLPLGVKSPNTPSPQKNKRKLDAEGNEEPSPAKPKEPTPKRVRRTKSTRQKSQLEIDMNDIPTPEITEEAPAQQIEDADNEEDTAEMDNAPATRRSTRLRSLRPTTAAAKSSIPTAIKLNRSGAGRAAGAVLNSALRSEQQELVNQTRHNTRKNKGNAVYPKQVLEKFALQPSEDSDEVEDEAKAVPKEGKKIGWKTPLESFQEEKPKETKAAPKTKVTIGKTGIAKPKTTTRTKRTSKVAESLGMVANGTPAKPQRMTRSRTRSQA